MSIENEPQDAVHFEEGLVHLADMLELADPRRKEGQEKISQTGLAMPMGGTYEEWKGFCLNVAAQLKDTLSQADSDDARATIDAAIDRIEQMLQ